MHKICKAWSENSNARCPNRAMWSSNYCWSHYPKKSLVIEFFIVFILTSILNLAFNDTFIYLLSKIPIPIFRKVDKNNPIIERMSPAIDKLSSIDKTTKQFEIYCTDKDSGLNLNKSSLVISRKENLEYIPVKGNLVKNNSCLSFIPEKNLEDGEYLIEIALIDNANNSIKFNQPFIVREAYELNAVVSYDSYDNSSESDKRLFISFVENNKKFFYNSKLYIYRLGIYNGDEIAILRDLYLKISLPEEIFCWEQVGNINSSRADIIGSDAEATDKRVKGYVYMNTNSININQIGPKGQLIFYILSSRRNFKTDLQSMIHIEGTYLAEGYGRVENRRIFISFK